MVNMEDLWSSEICHKELFPSNTENIVAFDMCVATSSTVAVFKSLGLMHILISCLSFLLVATIEAEMEYSSPGLGFESDSSADFRDSTRTRALIDATWTWTREFSRTMTWTRTRLGHSLGDSDLDSDSNTGNDDSDSDSTWTLRLGLGLEHR